LPIGRQVWSQDGINGKETPKGSLLKYTAHIFLRQLKTMGTSALYEVRALNKSHEIWQRDSLGIEIYDKDIAKQKLNYIHFQMAIIKK
jgi:putative transposase